MTTVTAVKRALEETASEIDADNPISAVTLMAFANSPTITTILANRLSDRGEAGNAMRYVHLAKLIRAAADAKLYGLNELSEALTWAIDQLTPPERAQP